MTKILVSGSRKWVEPAPILRELRRFPPGTILVHGGQRGVDNIAGLVGRQLGFIVRVYPADWGQYGKSAGPLRNQLMLEREHPDPDGVYVDHWLAFHEDPSLGRGTRNMLWLVEKADPSITIERFLR